MSSRISLSPWAVPILVGALIRLLDPTRQPLWVDETLTLQAASLGEPFRWHDVWVNPQGPLPHVWLRLWTAVFGGSDLALRLWSVFGGILGLGCAAAALRKWGGRAGLWGLWFFALSPFHVWYSLEVRNYVYMMAFAWVVLWALGLLRERPSLSRSLFLAGAMTLVLLSNLSGLFLVPAVVLAAFLGAGRRTALWVLAAGVVAVLVTTPWLIFEVSHHMNLGAVAGEASTGRAIRGGNTFSFSMLPYALVVLLGGPGAAPSLRSLHTGVSLSEWLTFIPVLAALGSSAGWLLWMSRRHTSKWELRALWLWALIPVGLAVVVGMLGFKAFNPRYVAVVLPAWITLLAYGAGEGMSRRPRMTGGAVLLLGAVLVFSGLRQGWDTDYYKEDFRAAARTVQNLEREKDLVLLEGVSGPFERYYAGNAPVVVFYARYLENPALGEATVRNLTEKAERIIWVGSRLWYLDPDRRLLDWLDGYGTVAETHTETGVEIRVYERGPG